MNTTLKIKLSIDEVNAVLRALGRLPYSQVYSLVDNIKSQATDQVQKQPTQTGE